MAINVSLQEDITSWLHCVTQVRNSIPDRGGTLKLLDFLKNPLLCVGIGHLYPIPSLLHFSPYRLEAIVHSFLNTHTAYLGLRVYDLELPLKSSSSTAVTEIKLGKFSFIVKAHSRSSLFLVVNILSGHMGYHKFFFVISIRNMTFVQGSRVSRAKTAAFQRVPWYFNVSWIFSSV